MNIQDWLESFKKYWINKDIDNILKLFSNDVEYWESPYQRIYPNQLRSLWEYIYTQFDIKLELSVFSNQEEKYTILWELEYNNQDWLQKYKWIYLMYLNNWICNYFLQVWEEKGK